jgi:hypothetical protein
VEESIKQSQLPGAKSDEESSKNTKPNTDNKKSKPNEDSKSAKSDSQKKSAKRDEL